MNAVFIFLLLLCYIQLIGTLYVFYFYLNYNFIIF